MSAYIHFFIKVGDIFQPIYEESRSGAIYEHFESLAPWEKIKPLTMGMITQVRTDAKDELLAVEKTIREFDERCKLIASFNNSTSEKLQAINDEEEIKEFYLEEKKPGLERVINFCFFLDNLIESASNLRFYDTDGAIPVDPDDYIYVGVETGSYVTKGDIK